MLGDPGLKFTLGSSENSIHLIKYPAIFFAMIQNFYKAVKSIYSRLTLVIARTSGQKPWLTLSLQAPECAKFVFIRFTK